MINSLKTFDKSIKKKPSSQKFIKVAQSIGEESEDELEEKNEPGVVYEREDSNKSENEVFPPKPKPLTEKVRFLTCIKRHIYLVIRLVICL